MSPSGATLLQVGLLGYLIAALAGLIGGRRSKTPTVTFGVGACSGLLIAIACASALASGSATTNPSLPLFPALLPNVAVSLRLDPLAALFGLLVSSVGLAISIYAIGYAPTYQPRKNPGLLGAWFNLLLLATTALFLADNVFFFLFAWEIMALSAYSLVSFEYEHDETRRAGVLFFVMSHLGTGCLILGFLLLAASAQSYAFADFHALGGRMSPGTRDAAFLLFLAGFGIKAGVVPVHIWLPAAHPVAPSNVSALMSGVLIKTGIYGLTRIAFDFMDTPPNWWGVTLLTLGTVSAVLGVLYALMEHDLKRLLAYHSIENIGIILMGLGASLMFLHTHHPVLAGLALAAGLYHTVNHALFKALLFLGAGAVLHATGTRNMEDLGGLIRRMPWTAAFFLVGAVAISALPPLNGFVSEWLTYQSLLRGFGTTGSLIRLLFPVAGAMLALTGALAAACFVKAFGITFLAQPRSAAAGRAHEVAWPMLAGQAVLAAACVVLGLFPVAMIALLDPVLAQFTGAPLSPAVSASGGWVLTNGTAGGGSVSPVGLALTAAALGLLPLALRWIFAARAQTHVGPTWDCGLQSLTPRMEYTATGFSKPIRMIFKALFRPQRDVQREYDFSPYFTKTLRFESHVEEVFQTKFYRPLHASILHWSRRTRLLQAGNLQAYIIYVFAALLGLLLFTL